MSINQEEKYMLSKGYIKAERAIPKMANLGDSGNTFGFDRYAHCPACNYSFVRKSVGMNTHLFGKTYKMFCPSCGQLLEVQYRS